MKSRPFLIIFLSLLVSVELHAVTPDYYLPDSVEYDPAVPLPSSVLGYVPGTWHASHDKIVEYMYAVARASDRVTVREYGRTYEGRPLLYVIVTAEENAGRLEEMRQHHLSLSDPQHSDTVDTEEVPLVVLLSYTIHGNEASGANAALLTVYYLAAAREPGLEDFLRKNIVIIDPVINPDGYSRFSEWVNSRRGLHPSSDAVSDEFHEPWPRGRGNHYWFDMNRDYLLLVNRESRARVRQFYRWRPNLVTDHHEMGSSSTFFFQPGIPSRNHPLTPAGNYDLTARIARYHARYLDRIGSQYFSEEMFDDYYYGKGSSFPDVNGGIGILFEQGSVRGHVRQTVNGELTFPFAIRNQFTVSLSTLAAAHDLRRELLEYQRTFFTTALKEAARSEVRGYLFGDPDDPVRTRLFVRLLQAHQIRVRALTAAVRAGDRTYPAGAYYVDMRQPQYRLITALFEERTRFRDSTFYDVSTWTFPLAYNMPFTAVKDAHTVSSQLLRPIDTVVMPEGLVHGGMSRYGYLLDPRGYELPGVLGQLLAKGVRVKAAMSPFTYDDGHLKKAFPYGTLFIPVQNQSLETGSLYRLLEQVVRGAGVEAWSVTTGLTPTGIDLGSGKMVPLTAPRPLLVTGDGISSYEAGEVWRYFDQVLQMPLTMVDVHRMDDVDLSRYNVLVLAGGRYSLLSSSFREELKRWLKKGGTLVALKTANRFAADAGLARLHFLPSATPDTSRHYTYDEQYRGKALEMINGTILMTRLDLSHPLCYGYTRPALPVFRNTTLAVGNDPGEAYRPVIYSSDPLLSGYISRQNLERLEGTPAVVVTLTGQGRVISFLDDPLFRGYFTGTERLFANAVFFRELLRPLFYR